MYTVRKAEIILTVPSIEGTAAWYERVLGWNGYVDDIDAVYARVTKSGVVPESAPVDQPWGRIFSMRDCDGFTLTFFADVKDFTVGEIQQL
ncbi:MAG: hypothetical protein JXR84_04955 [Anaerolineae bacterium]|nr:hypothetical protein [Anaerolineae bacterium]